VLDLCRLRDERPPPLGHPASPGRRRRQARVTALAAPRDIALVGAAARWLCLEGDPMASAAELVEVGALAAFGDVAIIGLQEGVEDAARALANPRALTSLQGGDAELCRRTFLHAEV